MKKIFIALILCLFLISAQETPHTVEIFTARGEATFPISFFNDGESGIYNAILNDNGSIASIQPNSINVPSQEFGSFGLVIDGDGRDKGVYFNSLKIERENEIVQEIPIIVGLESLNSEIEYDVSIDFNPLEDISIISGEVILSPSFTIYKLNYNNPGPNGVALTFAAYSLDGELLLETEEVASVSTQSTYEHFFNLGID